MLSPSGAAMRRSSTAAPRTCASKSARPRAAARRGAAAGGGMRHLRHRPADRLRVASRLPRRHGPRARPRDRRDVRRGREGVGCPWATAAFVAPNIGCGRCGQCRAGRMNLCRTPRRSASPLDGGFADPPPARPPTSSPRATSWCSKTGSTWPRSRSSSRWPARCAASAPCAIGRGRRRLIVGAGPDRADAPAGRAPARARRDRGLRAVEARRRQAAASARTSPWTRPSSRTRGRGTRTGWARRGDRRGARARRPGGRRWSWPRPGGRINFFGGLPRDRSVVELDTNLIHYRELVVTGTTANTTDDCREALELVLSGSVDTGALVAERRPLADAGAAFEAARSGDALKVVIEP